MSAGRNGQRERMLILLNGLAGKTKHYVAKMKSPAWVHDVGELTVVNSNIPSDTFNCVISRDLEEPDGPGAIKDVCSIFNSAGLPAAWWTANGIRASFISRELPKYQFVEDETDVGMLAELGSIPLSPDREGFKVQVANSSDDVLEFGRLLASLSDPPDSYTLAYYRIVSELDHLDSRMLLFLGFAGGRALSTASLFVDGDTGHLFDVSTSREFRGQGFGTAMLAAVLNHARGIGIRHVGTEAAPDGLNIYRSMGFEEVGTFRVYSNKRYIAETQHP
jgi:ribosomal protein S18 acetylase RimI-like enzyme